MRRDLGREIKSMKRSLMLLGIIATAILAQACVIAPGMTMTEPANVDDENVVQVQPITLELLKQMDVERQNAVRQLSEEFSS